ncbi:MAG: hypothetical protein P4L82_05740 [Ancalomicrobiaceae bacterium]|nr:hypothetical protein [Ancalomicrobiaceae bacterium]
MNALAIIKAIAGFASALLAFLHDRRLVDAATAAVDAAQQREVIDGLVKAEDARRRADSQSDAHPERLRDDDGFRRD